MTYNNLNRGAWSAWQQPRALKLAFFRDLVKRISRPWWVNFHREEWLEWAKVESNGRVSVYDTNGDFVRGTDYGSKRKAITALKRMGYHRYSRADQARATPPVSRVEGSSHSSPDQND